MPNARATGEPPGHAGAADEVETVVVIDDHPLFRKGVGQLLALDAAFRMVGEAGDGEAGVALVRALDPDLVLLDLNMRGMDGIATLAAIKADMPHVRVIVLTVSDSTEDLTAAIRAGADGYLLKDTDPEQMVEQLKRGVRGELVVSDALTGALVQALRAQVRAPGGGAPEDAADALTEREREILRALATGRSNKLIARDLSIAEGTVKVHVKNVLRKLGLKSRVEAAVWATRAGA